MPANAHSVSLQPKRPGTNGSPATVAVQHETRTDLDRLYGYGQPVASDIVPGSTARAGTSPPAPATNYRWRRSCLSCSRRSRPESSGHHVQPRHGSRVDFMLSFEMAARSKRPGSDRPWSCSDAPAASNRSPGFPPGTAWLHPAWKCSRSSSPTRPSSAMN